MARRFVAVLMLLVVLVVSTGCGSKTVTTTNSQGQKVTTAVPNVHFAKTKFVLHGALAYGAFHRYIYKPLKAGTFKKGAQGRTKALVKAGAAGLFVAEQLRQMRRDALSDDKLRGIAVKISNLIPNVGEIAAALKGGTADVGKITGAAGGLSGIVGAAKSAGVHIPLDKAPAL